MSGRQFHVHPLAEAEIAEAARWYDERSLALGVAFVKEVHDAIVLVLEAPKRWRVVREARRYLLGRFPFSVGYREISDEESQIIAVAHLKRRQGYWARR